MEDKLKTFTMNKEELINMEPILSVVVCTLNRAKLLDDCINSLINQTISNSIFEIIIIDNDSSDNTQQVIQKYAKNNPNIRSYIEKNRGHSYARNRGWRESKGQYIAYIDDDCIADKEWGFKIINSFETITPKPCAVGGQIFPRYESTPPDWFIDDFEIRSRGPKAGFLQPPNARFGFSGANMAFQRRIFEEYGGFSMNYGIVEGKLRMGEDTEYFYRIYEKEPWFWYDPQIKVFHWTPKDNFNIFNRLKRQYKSGKSCVYIENKEVFLSHYIKDWVNLLLLAAKLFLLSFIKNVNFKRKFVKRVEEFGSKLGYLLTVKVKFIVKKG